MERTALALLLCLAGCGGASSTSPPPEPAESSEPTPAEQRLLGCQTRYSAEHDVTMVYLPLPDDHVAGVFLPGEDWDGLCGQSDELMLEAVSASHGMFVAAGFQAGIAAPADLPEFARDQAEVVRVGFERRGLTIVAEQVTPLDPAMFSQLLVTDSEGVRMTHFYAQKFDPLPSGLFRLAYSAEGHDSDAVAAAGIRILEVAERSQTRALSELREEN